MKEPPLVSVIIPVYNAMTLGGGYIRRCLDSVLAQENIPIESIEIIVINDGSKDNSYEVLQTYEQKYVDTITLINQENIGVAKTRDKGVMMARGTYILFIDQDDYIDKNYIQTFTSKIEELQADVVFGGLRRPVEGKAKILYSFEPQGKEFDKYHLVSVWAKIHRRSFLLEKNVHFFDAKLGEDLPFTVRELMHTDRYYSIEYTGYNWAYNSSSVSNTLQKGLQGNFALQLIELLACLEKEYAQKSVMRREKTFHYFLIYTAVSHLLVSGKTADATDFVRAYMQTFAWLDGRIKYDRFILSHPSGVAMKHWFSISVFVILHKLKLMNVFAKIYCKGVKNE